MALAFDESASPVELINQCLEAALPLVAALSTTMIVLLVLVKLGFAPFSEVPVLFMHLHDNDQW